MTAVRLSPDELRAAALEGCLQQVDAVIEGRRHRYGYPGVGWDAHIEGQLSERALAKVLGILWTPTTFAHRHDGDVGRIEVRSTRVRSGYLLVHPDDPDDRPFVLMTGEGRDWVPVGWLYGSEAKQPDYWVADARPCFWVPQSVLRPVSAIPWRFVE